MRFALAALLLVGALAFVAADVSFPKPKTGRPTCILPIKRLTCVRDWRSGFVAGVRYGYGEEAALPGTADVCSTGIGNQTAWDMSDPRQVNTTNIADGVIVADPTQSPYYYPAYSPITQVIVLEAENPWGNKFGEVPAILFGYLETDGSLNFAVCGNAAYAQFYLNPAEFPPPPTAVSLKQVFTSPLSDEDTPSFLGGFYAVCATRGTGYLGGDPNKSSKYFIKKLTKVCFSPLAHVNNTILTTPPPFRPPFAGYDWWNNINYSPCHYDKKAAKKSASVSCAETGQVVATGKYGAIVFDQGGNAYDWDMEYGPDSKPAAVQQTHYQGKISMGSDPEPSYLSETAARS
eukprot:gene3101-3380_t